MFIIQTLVIWEIFILPPVASLGFAANEPKLLKAIQTL
jgi:hypothetical protein